MTSSLGAPCHRSPTSNHLAARLIAEPGVITEDGDRAISGEEI